MSLPRACPCMKAVDLLNLQHSAFRIFSIAIAVYNRVEVLNSVIIVTNFRGAGEAMQMARKILARKNYFYKSTK